VNDAEGRENKIRPLRREEPYPRRGRAPESTHTDSQFDRAAREAKRRSIDWAIGPVDRSSRGHNASERPAFDQRGHRGGLDPHPLLGPHEPLERVRQALSIRVAPKCVVDGGRKIVGRRADEISLGTGAVDGQPGVPRTALRILDSTAIDLETACGLLFAEEGECDESRK
jgi:hypothetical protein